MIYLEDMRNPPSVARTVVTASSPGLAPSNIAPSGGGGNIHIEINISKQMAIYLMYTMVAIAVLFLLRK